MRLATEDKLFDSVSALIEFVVSLSTENPKLVLSSTVLVRIEFAQDHCSEENS